MNRVRRGIRWLKTKTTAARVQALGILVLGISAVLATWTAATDEAEEDARQTFFLERIGRLEQELDLNQIETDCRSRLASDVDVIRAEVTRGLSDGLILLVTDGAESSVMQRHILYLQELNRQLREATERRDNALETCNQEE